MARAKASGAEAPEALAGESAAPPVAPQGEPANQGRARRGRPPGSGQAAEPSSQTSQPVENGTLWDAVGSEADGSGTSASEPEADQISVRGKKAGRRKGAGKVEVVRHGRDEMNLVEYPFASLWKNTEPGTEILHEWETEHPVTKRSLKAFWRVTGDPKLGLPTPSDEQVYLALMELTEESGLLSPSVHFTRHDLLRRLNWPVDQHYYNLLRDAFTRLGAVFITSQNAFWDAKARSFKTIGFNLIDNFEILEERRGRKRKEPREAEGQGQISLPMSFFKWNDVLFESFQSGYIRAIDLDFALSLRSSIALRLYRYLDKKSYDGRKEFEVELSVLCERHLGMKPCRYPSKFKERLSPAHDELLARSFLSGVRYEPMSTKKAEKVCYSFAERHAPGPHAASDAAPVAPFENWPDEADEGADEAEGVTSEPQAVEAQEPQSAEDVAADGEVRAPDQSEGSAARVQVFAQARAGAATSAAAGSPAPAREQEAEEAWSGERQALLEAMLELRVGREVARELVRSVEPSVLREQLDCLSDRAPKDPAAVFVKATREGWEPPRAFTDRREAAQRARESSRARELARLEDERARQARLESEAALEQSALDESARLDALWNSLGEDERRRIESQARERLGVLGMAGRAPSALEAMRRTLLRDLLAAQESSDQSP